MSDVVINMRFDRKKQVAPEPGVSMQYAAIYFDEALTPEQKDQLVKRFKALPSCEILIFHGSLKFGTIHAVGLGEKGEPDFVSQVKACARRYYTVGKVTYS